MLQPRRVDGELNACLQDHYNAGERRIFTSVKYRRLISCKWPHAYFIGVHIHIYVTEGEFLGLSSETGSDVTIEKLQTGFATEIKADDTDKYR
jgi:hypothetical protein